MGQPEQANTGKESFNRARELGQRGLYVAKHPIRSETMDVVDFDVEAERREAAGLIPGVNFWTAELPVVDNRPRKQ